MRRCELCKDFIEEVHQFRWKECKCKNLRVSGGGYTIKYPNSSVWVNHEGLTYDESDKKWEDDMRRNMLNDLMSHHMDIIKMDEFLDRWSPKVCADCKSEY